MSESPSSEVRTIQMRLIEQLTKKVDSLSDSSASLAAYMETVIKSLDAISKELKAESKETDKRIDELEKAFAKFEGMTQTDKNMVKGGGAVSIVALLTAAAKALGYI